MKLSLEETDAVRAAMFDAAAMLRVYTSPNSRTGVNATTNGQARTVIDALTTAAGIIRQAEAAVPEPDEPSAEDMIEQATQVASETAKSWRQRCYRIMEALNIDFGDNPEATPDMVMTEREAAVAALAYALPLAMMAQESHRQKRNAAGITDITGVRNGQMIAGLTQHEIDEAAGHWATFDKLRNGSKT